MTIILGLTGGIASGKSTVSQHFKSLNIEVVDADLIAREVMRAGQPVVKKIAELFGKEVLDSDGEINRQRLGELIFNSKVKRDQLNQLVQRKIRDNIIEQRNQLLEEEKELIVLDIPLLYEQNYDELVDDVMLVYVDEATQKKRLMKRESHLSEKEAVNRIKAQLPLDEKAKKADVVIDNSRAIKETVDQVDNWLKKTYAFDIEGKKYI